MNLAFTHFCGVIVKWAMLLKFLRQPNFYLQTQDNDVFSMKALWGFNKSDYLSSLTLSSAYDMVMITILKSDRQTQDCSYYCGNSLLEWYLSPWFWEMPFLIVCQFVNCVTCFLSAEFLVLMCFDVDPFLDVSSEKIFSVLGNQTSTLYISILFVQKFIVWFLSYLIFLYLLYFWGVRSLKPFPRIGHMFCFVSSLYLLQWISQTLEFCVCHCHVAMVTDAFIIEDVQYFRL